MPSRERLSTDLRAADELAAPATALAGLAMGAEVDLIGNYQVAIVVMGAALAIAAMTAVRLAPFSTYRSPAYNQ